MRCPTLCVSCNREVDMATVNPNYAKLPASYLFSEIARRVAAYKASNPSVEVFNLGIGNTTEPLSKSVIKGLVDAVEALGDPATYSGYGDEQGQTALRQALAAYYAERNISLTPDEIFISDGAKPDTANIQSIFGPDNVVAVPDPVYPVYVDSTVISGRTGAFSNGRFEGMVYLPCTAENDFAPELPTEHVDIIFLCSPNNPTGAVMTREQLTAFVEYARKNKAVIIFDAAYSVFISDPSLPQSIYEIPGAKECAIEINSFSKWAGFTGVRLGWCIVPNELVVEGTEPKVVQGLWRRRQTTMFNGASNIVQAGGLAVLSKEGRQECAAIVDGYMQNAKLIKQGLDSLGLKTYGGTNAPYVWVKAPDGVDSWSFFDQLLQEAHVVCTPGAGFGKFGEGYVRFSAFGHQDNARKAVESISKNLKGIA